MGRGGNCFCVSVVASTLDCCVGWGSTEATESRSLGFSFDLAINCSDVLAAKRSLVVDKQGVTTIGFVLDDSLGMKVGDRLVAANSKVSAYDGKPYVSGSLMVAPGELVIEGGGGCG